jgi:lipopolysaccharide biosynthesis glycosyltransferase
MSFFTANTRDARHARQEPIVLASVLSHAVNANFGVRAHALVDRINGVKIEKLEDVVKAFETGYR